MHSDGTLADLSRKWFKDANGEGVDYTIETNRATLFSNLLQI
jgi:hypothetical protein